MGDVVCALISDRRHCSCFDAEDCACDVPSLVSSARRSPRRRLRSSGIPGLSAMLIAKEPSLLERGSFEP